MTCPNTKPSQSTCLAKAGNDFLRDQDTMRKKLEEIDRTWEAIQAIDTSGTVPR